MRNLLLLLTLVVASQAQILNFSEFLTTFGKTYTDPVEAALRQSIFNSNAKKVQENNDLFNSGKVSYKLGLNKYSDLSPDEFNSMLKGLIMPSTTQSTGNLHQISLKALPASVDWRTKGAVTPVKDQKKCGSCYSFSTTGTIEGQWFLKKGVLTSLSEQQIVDCSRGYGNYGCDGGLMTNSYRYITAAGGIQAGSDYPYTATNGTCRFNRTLVKDTVSNSRNIQKNNETALQDAVANVGPIAIAIDASSSSFQLYKSGIFNNPRCSSTRLDHAVLAVGYGTDTTGRAFWIVKNSWGTSWGEQGYIRMSRNRANQCGVATMASYPIVP